MQRIKVPQFNINLADVIRETQAHPCFADFVVTEENLNNCLVYLHEHENCRACQGLASCKNHQVGYSYKFNKNLDEPFYLEACEYKKKEIMLNKQNEFIKTLYLPPSLQEATLADFEPTSPERIAVLKYVTNFLHTFAPGKETKGLIIGGPYRTGKTYILAALQKELSKSGVTSLLIYFPDLIRELKSSLGTPNYENLINKLKEVDVLMLDDLGSETMTVWLRDEVLGPILNYRLGAHKPLFASTNLTPVQLSKHFAVSNDEMDKTKTARIGSRLLGLSSYIDIGKTPYKKMG